MNTGTANVADEIANGCGIGLAEAGRLLPGRNGRRISPQTVLRWVLAGCKAHDGRTVRLEAARVGSAWCTTAAAISRFVAALSLPVTPKLEPSPPTRTAATKAGAELERLGL